MFALCLPSSCLALEQLLVVPSLFIGIHLLLLNCLALKKKKKKSLRKLNEEFPQSRVTTGLFARPLPRVIQIFIYKLKFLFVFHLGSLN